MFIARLAATCTAALTLTLTACTTGSATHAPQRTPSSGGVHLRDFSGRYSVSATLVSEWGQFRGRIGRVSTSTWHAAPQCPTDSCTVHVTAPQGLDYQFTLTDGTDGKQLEGTGVEPVRCVVGGQLTSEVQTVEFTVDLTPDGRSPAHRLTGTATVTTPYGICGVTSGAGASFRYVLTRKGLFDGG